MNKIFKILICCSLIAFNSKNLLCAICQVEAQYNSIRQNYIKQNHPNIPMIGIACSGGGNRAAISTLGFILGAKRIGILDTTSYFTALSGSTWSLCYLLANKTSSDMDSLTKIKNNLKQNLQHSFIDDDILNDIFSEKIRAIDTWGKLIANQVFHTNKELSNTKYSQLLPQDPTSFPFPICTAALNLSKYTSIFCLPWFHKNFYEMADVSPCCIWSDFLNCGCSMDNLEKSLEKEFSHPHNIDFFMALFGSAYSVNPTDVVKFLKEKVNSKIKKEQKTLSTIWKEVVNSVNYGSVMPPLIPNFGKGQNNYLSKEDYLLIKDGGFISNIPLIPLIRRSCQIIFICDSSDGCTDGKFTELQKVARYLKKNYIQFTSLKKPQSFTKKSNNLNVATTMKIFYGEKASQQVPYGKPTILYFYNKAKKTNGDVFQTTKFKYKEEQFEIVEKYMEESLVLFSDEIWKIINNPYKKI
ncbi:TPA: hypothetical protein DEO28_02790 [Candidatus Dependentiae bacterium]|nr:MAG: hypothetical protein UR14_C0005G0090 [candidate division TM6 bacterium GW2011_GWE2_31_21]KKP53167.1 MAG: hypothetical protein UR43_C0007G0091 [candidate division TM6 bacterium GW2011_GWF2_33_332]HBS47986.1 hypothetical protein [Candidatus Dependentiae bacterium]HBZ73410.1 hypothetical protein [Candidatus Dependentiae bacterium]